MDIPATKFLQQPFRATQRCPKCQSIYIERDQCESCGYRFFVDLLGEPLGPKSFYYLQKDFNNLYRYFGMELPYSLRHSSDCRSYLLRLNRRFAVLLDYLLSDSDAGTVRRKIYWVEMRDLTTELVRRGSRASELVKIVEEHSGHHEYRIVSSELIHHLVELSDKRWDLSLLPFDYRIGGVLRLSTLLFASFFTLIMISAALALYHYLLIG